MMASQMPALLLLLAALELTGATMVRNSFCLGSFCRATLEDSLEVCVVTRLMLSERIPIEKYPALT